MDQEAGGVGKIVGMAGMRTGSQGVRTREGQRWRFVDTGPGDPYFNMALDEAIARLTGRDRVPPTVRIYGWEPAAVSIGYAQHARQVIDLARCARQGIPVVRRLTGGRAVLHHREVTYSVIAGRRQWGPSASVTAIYRHIGLALVAAFQALGVDAQLSRPPADRTAARRRPGDAHPCFSSAGRYEVMARGRKLVGSAQRWLENAVLQHGSILLGREHSRLAELLPGAGETAGRRAALRLAEKTISLTDLLSRPVSYEEVSQALRSGFQDLFKGRLDPGRISLEERRLARKLVTERYGRPEWTLRI